MGVSPEPGSRRKAPCWGGLLSAGRRVSRSSRLKYRDAVCSASREAPSGASPHKERESMARRQEEASPGAGRLQDAGQGSRRRPAGAAAGTG